MAYLHEMALKNAQKKLYLLGSSDKRKDRSELAEGVGALGSSLVGAEQARAAQKKLKAKADAEARAADAKQFDEDVDFIRGNNVNSPVQSERFQVSQGEMLPQKYDTAMSAKEAQKAQQLNDLAEQTRMGGRYTPTGLQMADVNAQKDALDRLRMQSMIGIGGSLRMR
jgi:hypothetical protein